MQALQTEFFKHEIETKLFHFQTDDYGAHKASDAYLVKLRANADRFMETLRGHMSDKAGHIARIDLQVKAPTDKSYPKRVAAFGSLLQELKLPADVAAVRDELVADAHQLLYLLRFR